MATTRDAAVEGLSPRVRGNHYLLQTGQIVEGSIPACAGEPRLYLLLRDPSRVYPRVCGGTPSVESATVRAEGLSPRVRGNRRPSRWRAASARSIPACAGEPSVELLRMVGRPVYPRVCGGTAVAAVEGGCEKGLSPRVRGNLVLRGQVNKVQRSIPACAGEPSIGSSSTAAASVYPRVCGGTAIPSGAVIWWGGLSPRVRGNPDGSPIRHPY